MIDYPWYGLANDNVLQQGDLLFDCPFDQIDATEEGLETAYDVVVVSHSCDLAHDKLEMIQVCPFWSLEALSNDLEFFRSKRGREELRRGGLPGYHLLNRCELPGHSTGFLERLTVASHTRERGCVSAP